MEALICQFRFLSEEALQDQIFDPSTVEDLMKLFEIESYKAWTAAIEHEQDKEVEEAEFTVQQHCVMDEFEPIPNAEMDSLIETADSGSYKKMENSMLKVAYKWYI